MILGRGVFRDTKHARNIRIVVEPMKLGLLADEFFSSSLDGDEVGQVKLEVENGLFSCLPLELIDVFRDLSCERAAIYTLAPFERSTLG